MVVDHVELVGARIGGQAVLELGERLADPLARRGREDRRQRRLRVRVARSEQRHLVPGVDEPVGEQPDDPLDPPVAGRRHRKPDRADHGDAEGPFIPVMPAPPPRARPRAGRPTSARTRARRRAGATRPTSGSSSATVVSTLCRSRSGAQAEQHLQEQHGRAGRPGLRPCRGRVRDREGRRAARQPGEHLRQLEVEEGGRLEHPPDDPQRLLPVPVARKPRRDQGVVVGPDGAVVVRERAVPRVVGGHRADAPARPERAVGQRRDHLLGPLRRDDPAPEQVPDVGAHRVDALLLGVERERVVPAALVDPERLVEALLQLDGLGLEPLGELRIAPGLAGELRHPLLRVVDVPLHLAGCDRRRREPAVREALRVAGVLPRLVLEPALRPAPVLDEAVAVEVAVLVDPRERRGAPARAASSGGPSPASTATPPRAARGRGGSRRRCRSTEGTRPSQPSRAGPRGRSSPAPRRWTGRPRLPGGRPAPRARRGRVRGRTGASGTR